MRVVIGFAIAADAHEDDARLWHLDSRTRPRRPPGRNLPSCALLVRAQPAVARAVGDDDDFLAWISDFLSLMTLQAAANARGMSVPPSPNTRH